jgi:hypothetical protein
MGSAMSHPAAHVSVPMTPNLTIAGAAQPRSSTAMPIRTGEWMIYTA